MRVKGSPLGIQSKAASSWNRGGVTVEGLVINLVGEVPFDEFLAETAVRGLGLPPVLSFKEGGVD